ncbi:MAG TPA: WecB/TagA/CpsF family glycosyltransferase [Anaeromyxobacter sp.]|nr:WecB/TagA/CpsF family glycosyltransferase [Anaeromyxobacter sp.]
MAIFGRQAAPAAGAERGEAGAPPRNVAIRASRPRFMGCPFDPITMDEAVARALAWCRRDDGRPRTIVTMNAALLVAMRRDADLARACRAGDLVVPDGVPVVWASRLAGVPLPGRVAGVDLMPRLLEAAAEHGLPVFFLGAREEVVRELVRRCAARWPQLLVAGWRNGYFAPREHPEVVARIRRSGAAMLFVGMPSPFKETWCERHRDALGVPVILGVGGSFDVLAGFVPRAPRLAQRAGLEWLWRLAMEPRRLFRRYLVTNTIFVARAALEVARRAARAGRAGAR